MRVRGRYTPDLGERPPVPKIGSGVTAPHAMLEAISQWRRSPPLYDLEFATSEIDRAAGQVKAMADRIGQLEAAVLYLDELLASEMGTDPLSPVRIEIFSGPHVGAIVTIERPKMSA